jgi:hypothetical protein
VVLIAAACVVLALISAVLTHTGWYVQHVPLWVRVPIAVVLLGAFAFVYVAKPLVGRRKRMKG